MPGKLETLTCKAGGHDWTRVSARGRKPPNCPTDHTPVEPSDVAVGETEDGWMVAKYTPAIAPGYDRSERLYQSMLPLHERQERRNRLRRATAKIESN